MFFCPKCKQEIIYKAVSPTEQAVCEPELKTVITQSGHRIMAYSLHECRGNQNAEDKE